MLWPDLEASTLATCWLIGSSFEYNLVILHSISSLSLCTVLFQPLHISCYSSHIMCLHVIQVYFVNPYCIASWIRMECKAGSTLFFCWILSYVLQQRGTVADTLYCIDNLNLHFCNKSETLKKIEPKINKSRNVRKKRIQKKIMK